MSKIYRSPAGSDINLWSLYWEPHGSGANVVHPHSPDVCYPVAGWHPVKSEGADVLTDIIAGRTINSRIFTKDGQTMVLLYCRLSNGDISPSLYPRMKHMATTLISLKTTIGAQYVVVVQSMVKSSVGETMKEATDFFRLLAPILPAFGI